jgi:hypothetical protein
LYQLLVFSCGRLLNVAMAVCLVISCNGKAATKNQQGDQPAADGSKEKGVDSENAIVEEDVVRRIDDLGTAQPIGVLFRRHAAVYFLHRDEPHFDEWLAILRESQSHGSKIRFTYRSMGQRLTSVAHAKE